MAKQRKQSENYSFYDREDKEQSRHTYKAAKTEQNKKMMKNLDKALRSKDYSKLISYDNY